MTSRSEPDRTGVLVWLACALADRIEAGGVESIDDAVSDYLADFPDDEAGVEELVEQYATLPARVRIARGSCSAGRWRIEVVSRASGSWYAGESVAGIDAAMRAACAAATRAAAEGQLAFERAEGARVSAQLDADAAAMRGSRDDAEGKDVSVTGGDPPRQ
jgi:hypothetical protein